jgi:ketosteroid isomerase-like protein
MMAAQDRAEQLKEMERELAQAHLDLDLEAFDRLLHPEYTIIQPGGRIERKEETIASLRTGNRYWTRARSDELQVSVFGDTAVVIGRWTGKGRNGAEHFDYTARFLSVWVREDGCWRNVAAQSTPIA